MTGYDPHGDLERRIAELEADRDMFLATIQGMRSHLEEAGVLMEDAIARAEKAEAEVERLTNRNELLASTLLDLRSHLAKHCPPGLQDVCDDLSGVD